MEPRFCHRSSLTFSFLLFTATLFLFFSQAMGAQVTLSWNPVSPTPNGYRLYAHAEGEAYDYQKPAWEGSTTTGTVNHLDDNTLYYFVVHAVVGNAESGDSNEVVYTTPSATGPVISSISINGPSQVNENSSAQYTCTAQYSDGSSSEVTSGVSWSENSGAAGISASGLLTTGEVSSDTSMTITANYDGVSDTYTVMVQTVQDDAQTTLTSISISGPSQVNENSSAQYTCTAQYSDGSSSEVTSGVSWSENSGAASISASGLLTTTEVDASMDVVISASFNGQSNSFKLKINNSNKTCALTIDITGSGSVSLNPPGGMYSKGTVVTLTAIPDPGWAFDGWVGDVSDYDSIVTSVKIDADTDLSLTFLKDTDQDSIPDREESGPDSDDFSFDGNQDGIADYLQGNVVSIHTYDHFSFLTMSVPEPGHFASCRTKSADAVENALPAGPLPLGILSIEIEGFDPGFGSVLTIHLPAGQKLNTYYRYGATLDQADPSWYEFLYKDASQTGAVFKDETLSLYLKDGQQGDDDLRENGTISTTGGPTSGPVPASDENGSDDDDTQPLDIDLGNGIAVSGVRSGIRCFIDSLFHW